MLCTQLVVIDHYLRTEFSAAPVDRGLTDNVPAFMQLYRTEDGSRWFVTVVYAKGEECLVLKGTDLEDVPWILSPEIKGNRI